MVVIKILSKSRDIDFQNWPDPQQRGRGVCRVYGLPPPKNPRNGGGRLHLDPLSPGEENLEEFGENFKRSHIKEILKEANQTFRQSPDGNALACR
jgi:hypothetical protein